MKKLNVLCACECSGVVRDAFRKLGHNAWSCDLLPCDGDPCMSVQDDVLALLRGDKVLATDINGRTERGRFATNHWDLMIAHPPCTYLCNSGVRWLIQRNNLPNGVSVAFNTDRHRLMVAATVFFNLLWSSQIPHIAIENPIMHSHARLRLGVGKQPQIIQPWMFGHPETKATCLWLKNLPKLTFDPFKAQVTKAVMWELPKAQSHRIHNMSPGPYRAKMRSKTFKGIAEAMALQWSEYIQTK